MKHSTIVIRSLASYINKWKNISGITNSHQYHAKETFVTIIKEFVIDWHLYSDMLAIHGSNTVGQIPNLIAILGNIFSVISGSWRGRTCCSLRQSQIADYLYLLYC